MSATARPRLADPGPAANHRDGLPPTTVRLQAVISEATASSLVRAALDQARGDGGDPVAVGVVDVSGELVAFLRGDGAPLRAIRLSIMKAYTSARFGRTTAALQQTLLSSGHPLVEYGDSGFTALAGGVPVIADGETIGGIGVSGRHPEVDHQLAMSAVRRLAAAPEVDDDPPPGFAHQAHGDDPQ